jgi:hypothetical protein
MKPNTLYVSCVQPPVKVCLPQTDQIYSNLYASLTLEAPNPILSNFESFASLHPTSSLPVMIADDTPAQTLPFRRITLY